MSIPRPIGHIDSTNKGFKFGKTVRGINACIKKAREANKSYFVFKNLDSQKKEERDRIINNINSCDDFLAYYNSLSCADKKEFIGKINGDYVIKEGTRDQNHPLYLLNKKFYGGELGGCDETNVLREMGSKIDSPDLCETVNAYSKIGQCAVGSGEPKSFDKDISQYPVFVTPLGDIWQEGQEFTNEMQVKFLQDKIADCQKDLDVQQTLMNVTNSTSFTPYTKAEQRIAEQQMQEQEQEKDKITNRLNFLGNILKKKKKNAEEESQRFKEKESKITGIHDKLNYMAQMIRKKDTKDKIQERIVLILKILIALFIIILLGVIVNYGAKGAKNIASAVTNVAKNVTANIFNFPKNVANTINNNFNLEKSLGI